MSLILPPCIRGLSFASTTVLITFIAGAVSPALGQPTTPEAAQFESVEATDLVNRSTGDFVYTVPLVEVPGPEGSYPITLSYHSGIGPNQEATWVGLGWSLNPGAINRIAKGYPDEYAGAPVYTTATGRDEEERFTVGVYYGLKYGQVGFNMTFDGNWGVHDFGGSAMLSPVSIGDSPLSLVPKAGVSYSRNSGWGGTAGVGIKGEANDWTGTLGASVSFGKEGIRGGSVSASAYRTRDGLSFSGSINSQAQASVGFQVASGGTGPIRGSGATTTVGFSTSSVGEGQTFSSTVGITIPIPTKIGVFSISLQHSQWKWVLDDKSAETGYGYANLGDYLRKTGPNGDSSQTEERETFERHRQGRRLYSSPDNYQVTAQGLSGTFRPYRTQMYTLFDQEGENHNGNVRPTEPRDDYTKDDLVYRFQGEKGGNLIVQGEAPYDQLSTDERGAWYGSRRIIPHYGEDGQEVTGFTILTRSGKRYIYSQPVKSLYEFSYTTDPEVGDEEPLTMTTSKGQRYPTQWRLTAVLGPDYVDRGNPGVWTDSVDVSGISSEDWGYWVKFKYDKSDLPRIWRTPWSGMQESPRTGTKKSYSYGIRQEVYLSSVETATHVADFNRSEAKYRNDPPGRSWIKNFEPPTKEVRSFPRAGLPPRRDTLLVEGDSVRKGFWGRFRNKVGSNVEYWIRGDLTPFIGNASEGENVFEFRNCIGGCPSDGYIEREEIEVYKYESGYTKVQVSEGMSSEDASIKTTDGFFPTSYMEGVKLDSIELVRKSDGEDQQVKSVHLRYDYQLRPNSPGSDASYADGAKGGTLTLRNVLFKGRNGSTIIPPYRFRYANGDAPGEGLNPKWHQEDWDRWGSYRDPDGSNGSRLGHLTPQDQDRADKAAAWSLTKITTPTGGEITVDYESDDYHLAGTARDLIHRESYTVTNVDTFNAADAQVSPPPGYVVGYKVDFEESGGSDNDVTDPFQREDQIILYKECEVDVTRDQKVYLVDEAFVNVVNEENIRVLSQRAPRVSNRCENTSFKVYRFPQVVYGGGVRVKEIATMTRLDTVRTRYRYRNPDGTSTGVTPTLPETHASNNLRNRFPELEASSLAEEYLEVYNNYGTSYRRPAPGVVYSRVEVVDVGRGESSSLDNGKSVYKYVTAKDHPYEARCDLSGCEFEDFSHIYGRLKEVTHYEHVTDDYRSRMRPVERRRSRYAFGSALSRDEQVQMGRPRETGHRGATVDGDSPLGQSQERYSYEIETEDDVIDGDMNRSRHISYGIGATVENYTYESGGGRQEAFTSSSRTFIWDARTGSAVASASQKSDGTWQVTRQTPAHWIYEGMLENHQLSQQAKEVSYRTEASLSPDAVASYSFPSEQVVSASVTTWSNELGPGSVWRKNDTHEYNAVMARQGSGDPTFTRWDEGGDARYPEVSPAQPWEMTSNVTEYDRFSHPVERKREDGTYETTVYGHNQAEVVGVATNARESEVIATSFEGLSPGSFSASLGERKEAGVRPVPGRIRQWKTAGGGSFVLKRSGSKAGTESNAAHTGRHYVKVNPGGGTVSLRAAVSAPEAGRYQLSAWTQGAASLELNAGGAGTSEAGSTEEATVSGWTLQTKEVDVNGPGTVEVHLQANGGSAQFDAVRLHPADARMKTYAYAPLSREVTAMVGPDNRAQYYEYDDAGRLVRVRNSEGELTKQHRYFSASFVLQDNGDPWSLNAEPSYGPIETYRWEIDGTTKTGSEVTLNADSGDTVEPTLVLLDDEGQVRARRRDQLSLPKKSPEDDAGIDAEIRTLQPWRAPRQQYENYLQAIVHPQRYTTSLDFRWSLGGGSCGETLGHRCGYDCDGRDASTLRVEMINPENGSVVDSESTTVCSDDGGGEDDTLSVEIEEFEYTPNYDTKYDHYVQPVFSKPVLMEDLQLIWRVHESICTEPERKDVCGFDCDEPGESTQLVLDVRSQGGRLLDSHSATVCGTSP